MDTSGLYALIEKKDSHHLAARWMVAPSWNTPVVIAGLLLLSGVSQATPPPDCPKCDEWTASQTPFKVYGNTYYVGTHGISTILVTSPKGHILIDGGVAEAAPQIAEHIRALGFRVEDIHLILNSHVHFDHAGGIAALQHMSGAQVAASASSAQVLTQGHSDPDDPLFGDLSRGLTPIKHVRTIADRETVKVGSLTLTAHLTPGHTPGGTTWTWQSCENDKCLNIVYADSLSAVSANTFKFSNSPTYPNVLKDFQKSFSTFNALPCDILLTNHPEFSDVFGKLERRDSGADVNAFVSPDACKQYAEAARANLEHRVAQEKLTDKH